ncbi:NADH-quinone oxidoreductase subunit NuoE [Dehalobacter sp. DCM]|uniref:NADH-quinone oxidoreductase subunit NuoE n=1 Tax=Dehalobacter sp. DCM TaxID=2907827 RepID=UPI003081C8A4|nr:NADH-quinone oxidoreductase subunit NuoE [Dehalobacter sp. DCM]
MCKCCDSNPEKTIVDPKQDRLQEIIASHQGHNGALIPVLQEAQEVFGYLPEDVMRTIAKGLKVPEAQVYGVATFYAQFRLKPAGRNLIRVCMGTACHVRGAQKVLTEIERELHVDAGETTADQKFTLETVACIGACGLAPVMTINGQVFGNMNTGKVPEILKKFE